MIFLKGFLGLYRGYFATISREIPFSIIQFPLWEFFKVISFVFILFLFLFLNKRIIGEKLKVIRYLHGKELYVDHLLEELQHQ